MSERTDAIRGLLTDQWQYTMDIADVCLELGYSTNLNYAKREIHRLYHMLEKYGLAEKATDEDGHSMWRLTE